MKAEFLRMEDLLRPAVPRGPATLHIRCLHSVGLGGPRSIQQGGVPLERRSSWVTLSSILCGGSVGGAESYARKLLEWFGVSAGVLDFAEPNTLDRASLVLGG